MIVFLIVYIIFLAIYLPLNFYMVFRVHEMKLVEHDRSNTAISFFIAGIAIVILLSLITIAIFDWPSSFGLPEVL